MKYFPGFNRSLGIIIFSLVFSLTACSSNDTINASSVSSADVSGMNSENLNNQSQTVNDTPSGSMILKQDSRYHLRAFVRNLERRGMAYQPQYLSGDVSNTVIF